MDWLYSRLCVYNDGYWNGTKCAFGDIVICGVLRIGNKLIKKLR